MKIYQVRAEYLSKYILVVPVPEKSFLSANDMWRLVETGRRAWWMFE